MRVFGSTALVVSLLVAPALAQFDAVSGTWSGHWVPEPRARDAVTVRFTVEDAVLTGELLNPVRIPFKTVTFDADTRRVVAEAEHGELGRVRLEGRIEEDTRLNGTLSRGDVTGEMRLTKWTYVVPAR